MMNSLGATMQPGLRSASSTPSLGVPEIVPWGAPSRRVLVGTGPCAVRCARRLSRDGGSHRLIGAVDSSAQPQLRREFPEVPYLGSLEDLPAIVHTKRVDEIVIAVPLRSMYDELWGALHLANDLGVRASVQLDLPFGDERLRVEHRGDGLDLAHDGHRATRWPWRPVKRAIDLLIAGLALILLSPLFLVAAVSIKLSSPGPVFFRQVRIGRGGRAFTMLKFRTMVVDAEEQRKRLRHINDAGGASFKIFDDPRVIRVGHVLRRTSIDELPQLFNVLRGEMSVVGPRPLPVWVAEQMECAAHHRRWSMLPGLTGLWQVRGRQQDFDIMGRFDVEYVDRWSIWLDLAILWQTPQAVLGGENAF